MKKILSISFISVMMLFISACGASTSDNGVNTTSKVDEEITSEKEKDNKDVDTVKPEGNKILIAYFSRSGNTETIAKMVQKETNGELLEIETVRTYSNDYDTVLDEATEEQRTNTRPELKTKIENIDDYDVVFIGYPIWWSDTPMAILSFLESYNLSGKTVIPFCTHGGGGSGSSFRSVESASKGATIKQGFDISGSSASTAQSSVLDWLQELGY